MKEFKREPGKPGKLVPKKNNMARIRKKYYSGNWKYQSPGNKKKEEPFKVTLRLSKKFGQIRTAMQNMEDVEALKFLFSKMSRTRNNDEFLAMMNDG